MSLRKYIGTRQFYRSVLALTVPIIVQNGITNFVSLLDNVMVGRLGTEQLSGVGIANQLIFVYMLCLIGGLAGSGIFTAQYFGQHDADGLRSTFRFKLITAFLLTVGGIVVLSLFGSDLVSLFLTDDGKSDLEATMRYATDYLRIVLLALAPTTLTQVYASTLRETGHTVPPMAAGIVAVVTNGVFNYLLIFGALGFPRLGVQGAAIATVLARVVELLVVMIWAHTHRRKAPYLRGAYRSLRIPAPLARRIIVKGCPLMVNELLWALGVTVLNQCYSTRGVDAVAAVNIAVTVSNLFNILYMSTGSAVSIMVGRLLGAGEIEEARDADRKIIAFSSALCLLLGVVMALLAPPIASIYKVSDTAKSLSVVFMVIHAAMMPFNAFTHNCYFTLRTGGQALVTFLFDSGFMWLICVPTTFLVSRLTALPIIPLFVLTMCFDLMKCLIGLLLLRSGRWANKLI